MDKTTTFTQQSQPFPPQFCFSYTVKSVQTENINTLNVPNTSMIIVIDEHQDTEYLIVTRFEAGDFNHSGDIVTNFLFSTMCMTCFYRLFFIYDRTCIFLKADMPFTYAYHTFTIYFTCVCLEANTPSLSI